MPFNSNKSCNEAYAKCKGKSLVNQSLQLSLSSCGHCSQSNEINKTGCLKIIHATIDSAQNILLLLWYLWLKSYKHQNLRHVTFQDKERRYTFYCDVLSKLEKTKWVYRNLCSATKPLFICPDILTKITLEWGGGGNPHVLFEGERGVPISIYFVFYAEKKVFGCGILRHVGEIPHADSFWKKRVLMSCYFIQTERLCLLIRIIVPMRHLELNVFSEVGLQSLPCHMTISFPGLHLT